MWGQSAATLALIARLDRLGPTSLPVLIRGETGTGKEVVARYLHQRSSRSEGPFIPVDCASIAEELIESELFGHERGAFTGARQARSGLVQAASGGTFFLDEVAELSLSTQTRLLRLLEAGTYRPVGATTEQSADLRVLAATWVDLEQAVEQGRFRQDLYHRLAVVEELIPPLRARPDDILPIAQRFLAQVAARDGQTSRTLSDPLRSHLKQLRWPGNVRELRNTIEYLVALGPGPVLHVSDLPPRLHGASPTIHGQLPAVRSDLCYSEARRLCLEQFQAEYVRQVLDQTGGNVSEAARLAQMDRRSIQRILNRESTRDDS